MLSFLFRACLPCLGLVSLSSASIASIYDVKQPSSNASVLTLSQDPLGHALHSVALNESQIELPQSSHSSRKVFLGDVASQAHSGKAIQSGPAAQDKSIWQRSWAYPLSFAALIGLVFFALRLRTARQRDKTEELERIVKIRTRDLAGKNRELENSLRDQSEMLAELQALFTRLSHEFRTPLTLIQGPLEHLLQHSDERDTRHLSLIQRNTQQMAYLVDQILLLGRLESKAQISKRIYPIQDVLESLSEAFKPVADRLQLGFQVHLVCDGHSEWVEDTLECIVSNLLSNAFKYTPAGGTVAFAASVKDQSLSLSISDNGIGIAAEQRPFIFKQFVRANDQAHVTGSGIGLALVKELVNRNDGQIEVQSEQNKGSTFTVTLPIKATNASRRSTYSSLRANLTPWLTELDNSIPTSLAHPLEVDDAIHQYTVLIVEDNADMREYIGDGLSGQYHCLYASDGEQGLQIAQEALPDLILSDVMMPIMSGVQLVERLKSRDLTAHIPVVMLTAKDDNASRMALWQYPIDDYIAKPFNMDELVARIHSILSVRDMLKRKFSHRALRLETESHALLQDSESELPASQQAENDPQRDPFFQRFSEVVAAHFSDERFNRAKAAALLAISERQLNRKLNALMDYNFAEYLRRYRLRQAASRLAEGQSITDVAFDVGFSSASYFSTCFRAEYGVAPSQYQAKQPRR